MQKIDKTIFWTPHRMLTYNRPINMIVGKRSVGKTYGSIKLCVDEFKKHNREFVYVRRTETELDTAAKKLFNAVRHDDSFKEDSFHYADRQYYMNGVKIGDALALSTANKSKSNTFDNSYNLVYDEYLVRQTGRNNYLKNEVEDYFLELLYTIFRLRDFRCILLANNLSWSNPYYRHFGVQKPTKGNVYANETTYFEDVTSPEFDTVAKQSMIGQVIKGTRYEQYAIDGEYVLDNYTFIQKRTENADFWYAVKYCDELFGVWMDYKNGYIYIDKTVDPSTKSIYSFTRDDHSENTLLTKVSRTHRIQVLLSAYTNGLVRFNNLDTKNTWNEIFGLFNV